jgi:hypothetical protein
VTTAWLGGWDGGKDRTWELAATGRAGVKVGLCVVCMVGRRGHKQRLRCGLGMLRSNV